MTPSEERSSGSGSLIEASGPAAARWPSAGRALRLALLAALVVWVVAAPTSAQEEEDLAGAIEKYRGILQLANQRLEDLDLPEALARYTEVIDAYKAGKLPATTALTRQLVGQAYEGRARTHANLGRNREAEADYEALLRLDISWPIDRTRTSPKIVALYDNARKRLVATLAVKSEPPGAKVSLDGTPVGRSPMSDYETAAGSYVLRIEADGFEPVEETIALEPGSRLERSPRLVPNARALLVATAPVGARVSLDGKAQGVTFGSAGSDYAEIAARLEIPLSDISAPLHVEHAKPGSHLLRIEKECYEPQLLSITVTLDPNDPSPVRYEPIRLTPSLGGLALDSAPRGAEAVIDGRTVGKTPVSLDGVCSGRHEVRLSFGDVGRWVGAVDVVKGKRVTLSERPRMTMAYVGMTVSGPMGKAPAGEQEVGDALAELKSFNVLRPGDGLPESLLARRMDVADGGDLPAERVAAVAQETGADLIAWAHPAEGGFGRRVTIVIQAARPSLASLKDTLEVSLDDQAAVKALVAALDSPARLAAPWIGLHVVELHRAAHPIVTRIVPGSPAAKSGVRLGDAVLALGGRSIGTGRDLATALAGLRAGAQASLSLQGTDGTPRQVNLEIGSTPLMLPAEQADQRRARLAAELGFTARLERAFARPDSDLSAAAQLSLAALLMRQGLFAAALTEALDRAGLPEGAAGLSAGTVSYLKGLCLVRLNRSSEAHQQLTKASQEPDATLWSDDGPPVADRAQRMLQKP